MATNFSRVLPLLERLDDEAIAAWGKSFDWTIPEFDVRGLTAQAVQPARSLLIHGSPRLKRLLLRPDMFGEEDSFVCDSVDMQRANRPLGSSQDLWNDVWATAWALGDLESIDQMEPWLPRAIMDPPSTRQGVNFLTDWACNGAPEHIPALLERFRKLVTKQPTYEWSQRGRARERHKAAVIHWMASACTKALQRGNDAWVEAVRNILPEATAKPTVVAAALTSGRFAMGRRLMDDLPEKPKLSDTCSPDGVPGRASWLHAATHAWKTTFWGEGSTDDDALAEAAEWIAKEFGTKDTPLSESLAALHAETIPHMARWGPRWLELITRHGVAVSAGELESMARQPVTEWHALARLEPEFHVAAETWERTVTACLTGTRADLEAAERVAHWAGRYSGMHFPSSLEYLPEASSLNKAWGLGHAERLMTSLPFAQFNPSRPRL